MSLSHALEPLVPTAVHLLSESVRLQKEDGRGVLAYLVRVLPLVNREARDLWRKERWRQVSPQQAKDFLAHYLWKLVPARSGATTTI